MRQMQVAMGEGGGSGGRGLIENLHSLGAAITPDSNIQSLNYTIERGEMAVDLFIPGYEELDRVKDQLASRGLSVEIASAEQQERGVRARMRVREPEQGG